MSIVAGWYHDPLQPGQVRWWNGVQWTHDVQQIAPVAPPVQPVYDPDAVQPWSAINLVVPQAHTLGTRALIWGIVAFLLPIALLPGVMAVSFGASALSRSRRLRDRGIPDPQRALAIVGTVFGAISLATLVIGIVALVALQSGYSS